MKILVMINLCRVSSFLQRRITSSESRKLNPKEERKYYNDELPKIKLNKKKGNRLIIQKIV